MDYVTDKKERKTSSFDYVTDKKIGEVSPFEKAILSEIKTLGDAVEVMNLLSKQNIHGGWLQQFLEYKITELTSCLSPNKLTSIDDVLEAHEICTTGSYLEVLVASALGELINNFEDAGYVYFKSEKEKTKELALRKMLEYTNTFNRAVFVFNTNAKSHKLQDVEAKVLEKMSEYKPAITKFLKGDFQIRI